MSEKWKNVQGGGVHFQKVVYQKLQREVFLFWKKKKWSSQGEAERYLTL